MQEPDELKPCPFCGLDTGIHIVVLEEHFIFCENCGGQGPIEDTPAAAAQYWNHRE